MGPDVNAGRDGAALITIPAATSLVATQPSSPGALAVPVTAFGVMASIGLGLYAGTLLVTVGLVVLVLGLASLRVARRAMRRAVQAHFQHKQRWDRRRARERRLYEAGVSHDALAELTILADEIERRDPALARRFELDEMLDRHVVLSLAHERCLRAMRMCDRDQLARARSEHLSRTGGSRRRADMFERRIRYWDQCKAQSDRCDEELAVLADMIRLLAQKAICPASLVDDDSVERQLVQLDDEEHALHQLSMMSHG